MSNMSAVFPSKRAGEKITLRFTFGDQMLFGETLSGAVISVSVSVGTDASPAAILFGSAVVTASGSVTQQVFNGLPGVVYHVICTATSTSANMYTQGGYLAIVAAPGSFIGPT